MKPNAPKPKIHLPEIVVTRIPIFNKKKDVFAYQLLFHSKYDFKGKIPNRSFPVAHPDENSTEPGLDSIFLAGLKKLTGGRLAFIHFSREMILHQVPYLFPNETVGIGLVEDVDEERTIQRIVDTMKSAGYLVMIDDRLFNEGDISLVRQADIIGVDFRSEGLTKRLSVDEDDPMRPRFLAKSVETPSDFDFAVSLGYHYFQGDFFCKPNIISIRDIPGNKMNYMRILQEIHKPSVQFDQVEEILKHDVSLTYKLLRFINSAMFGLKTTVQSIRQALTYLGEEEVRKWLSMIVLSGLGEDKPHELVVHTLVRARFCESIASALHLYKEAPKYFLVGMLSNIDAFLDRPMEEIMKKLPLEKEIKSTLLGGSSSYKDVLDLVLDYETANWQNVTRDSKKIKLDMTEIANMYVDSVEWGKLI